MPVSLYILACLNTNKPLLKYMYGFVVKFTSYNLPAIYLHTHTDSKTGPPLHLRILSTKPQNIETSLPRPLHICSSFLFPKMGNCYFPQILELEREKKNTFELCIWAHGEACFWTVSDARPPHAACWFTPHVRRAARRATRRTPQRGCRRRHRSRQVRTKDVDRVIKVPLAATDLTTITLELTA